MKKTQLEEDLIRTNYYSLYQREGLLSCIDAGYFIESPGIDFNQKSYVKKYNNNFEYAIYTGAFCPFHEGHLDCIKKALKYVGFVIVIPDHDEYVSKKTGGYMNAAQRCAYISDVLLKEGLSDRVSVDISFSCMESNALNFTTIQNLCKEKYGTLPYILIGEDNISFRKVISCISHERSSKSISSTEIRNTTDKNTFILNKQKKDLILRMSKNDSYPYFIEKYYNKVTPVYIEDQIDWLNKNYDTDSLLSLDSMTVLKNNLRVSRGYRLYGHQFTGYKYHSLYISSRNKEYTLLDDDIYTGNTISCVREFLRDEGYLISDNTVSYVTREANTEVLDLRDLFAFGDNSGLYLSDYKSRALYAYPFVDPYVRASVLNPLEFSYDVWKYNLKLSENNMFEYSHVNRYIQYNLYANLTDNLLNYSVYYIIRHYLELLEKSYQANISYL